MPNFAYVAKDKKGAELSGFLSGGSLDEVVRNLHERGFIVLHVAEDQKVGLGMSWQRRLMSTTIGSASTRDLALFTRQLATILEAGIPLIRGLRGLAADTSSRILKRAVNDVALRIEKGEGLSDAMAMHPEAFNRMYISMIRAGERAGTLDQILEELAVYLEKIDAIRTKIRAALSYPVFISFFAVTAALVLLLKVVPTFQQIYSELGQSLPSLTLAVVAVSDAIRQNALLSIGLAAMAILLWMMWVRTRWGRYAYDSFLIRVPIFGPIVRKSVMSRFARTLGILLTSGLPILDSLDLVKGASGNEVVSRAVEKAKVRIGGGQSVTGAFRSTKKFPEMVLQLMSTGEESGELDAMLLKASDFYDRQVEASVHSLTSLIEPVMIVLVGAMIGLIVVSMFLPILYLGDEVMKGGMNY